MSKLLMLKGLPASGKSTHAKELAENGYVRVNKDDLRSMLHAGKWSKNNEKQVLRLRDSIITDALNAGNSVVVDDTNLAEKHTDRLKQLAKEHGAKFETKFFDVSVEECVKRDLARANSVGEKVIRGMYNQFLRPAIPELKYDPALPYVIICDLDGTLAHMNGRGPYDTTGYLNDTYDEDIGHILEGLQLHNEIVFLSGRSSDYRDETKEWLATKDWVDFPLYMRASGDMRNDAIVKKELYEEYIKGKYNVRFILDDRNRVVEMWRENGLKVLQVADGDF